MKRSDFLKSTTAAVRGSVTEIHKSAAQGNANRIPAAKLWRIVRTGLDALTVSFLVSVGQRPQRRADRIGDLKDLYRKGRSS